jgi:hypothetical protein
MRVRRPTALQRCALPALQFKPAAAPTPAHYTSMDPSPSAAACAEPEAAAAAAAAALVALPLQAAPVARESAACIWACPTLSGRNPHSFVVPWDCALLCVTIRVTARDGRQLRDAHGQWLCTKCGGQIRGSMVWRGDGQGRKHHPRCPQKSAVQQSQPVAAAASKPSRKRRAESDPGEPAAPPALTRRITPPRPASPPPPPKKYCTRQEERIMRLLDETHARRMAYEESQTAAAAGGDSSMMRRAGVRCQVCRMNNSCGCAPS